MNEQVFLEKIQHISLPREQREIPTSYNVGLLVFSGRRENSRILLRRGIEGIAPPIFDDNTEKIMAGLVDSTNKKTIEIVRIPSSSGKKSLRIFSTILDEAREETSLEEYIWVEKSKIQYLAQRTDAQLRGEIEKQDWELSPGLDPKWYDYFQKIGILDDPDQTQRGRIPRFIYGRTPIAGRYYGKEYETTQAASKALDSIGIAAYPKPDAPSVTISSTDGDTFSFLGGDQLTISPYQAQLGFFREIQRSHDIPMVDRFIYVAINNGYLGRTASIEVAFAIANNKRLIFSESPTRFSYELPSEIVSVIQTNYRKFPHLAVEDIPTSLSTAIAHDIEDPVVTEVQKEIISASIFKLIIDLRKKFGTVET